MSIQVKNDSYRYRSKFEKLGLGSRYWRFAAALSGLLLSTCVGKESSAVADVPVIQTLSVARL